MPSLKHCDLLRYVGVNNLPKVVTRQHHGRKLNSQPSKCESNTLTTRLLSHPIADMGWKLGPPSWGPSYRKSTDNSD